MLTIRPAEWPKDIPILAKLDTSFTTDRIYRVTQDGFRFCLEEEALARPQRKRYPFDPSDTEERDKWQFTALTEIDGKLAGFTAAEHLEWNNRAHLRHLYVSRRFRGRGVGSRLVDAVCEFARSVQARSVWLETQNINYPAIQFYERSGFSLCGLDTGLYDPSGIKTPDIALFFEKSVR